MNTDSLGLIGAVAGVGIPAVMSLVAWLWTSRERDSREALQAQNVRQQLTIDDHEKRIRCQESGEAIKELRDELRNDFLKLAQQVQAAATDSNRQLALMAVDIAGIKAGGGKTMAKR